MFNLCVSRGKDLRDMNLRNRNRAVHAGSRVVEEPESGISSPEAFV
jgi:hypothetical protein